MDFELPKIELPKIDVHSDQANMPKRYNPERHLDKRIRNRLTLYFFLAIIFLAISIFHIFDDGIDSFAPLFSLVFGMLLGLGISRMFHISWDHGGRKAISRMDAFGVLILVAYVVLEVYRDEIFENFVHGPALVAASFAFFAGTMMGRFIGIRGRIREVVSEHL